MKLLTWRQARWLEFLSQFNLVICFCPGKLWAKPDSLTRWWDVYLKEGERDYASVNLHNLRPVFTNKQLASSLRATSFYTPVLRASIIMDIQSLHSDIRSTLCDDPAISEYLSNPIHYWSKDPEGLLHLDNHIYVPDMGDLQLKVLQHNHDHPIAGHFGQNRTIDLIRRSYIWPELWNSIKSYIKSCTTCICSKPQRHRPYGLLKQLPIPEQPWNSISMDFIEKLPPSSGFDTILVIVDRLTKQSIFIPTVDTINAQLLAKLFVLHVFSKHRVLSHVTSDWGTEFVSSFFQTLGKALDMKLFHFQISSGGRQTNRIHQSDSRAVPTGLL